MRCLVVDGRPVRQQVTATYLARMGLRVDLSDSVPAAALALRHFPGIYQALPASTRWVTVNHPCGCPGTAMYLARMGLQVDLEASLLLLPWRSDTPGTSQGLVNRKSRWDMVVVDADADGPGTGIELGRMVQQLKELREAPGTGIELGRMVQQLKELREAWETTPIVPKLLLLLTQQLKELREAWEATPIVPKLLLLSAGHQAKAAAAAAVPLGQASPGGRPPLHHSPHFAPLLSSSRPTAAAAAAVVALGLNPRETTALATRRRQLLLRLCLKGKRVLVVDHHYITRKAAAELVSHFADVVVAVDSSVEALSRLTPLPHSFQLILVNIRLADMPGFEFTEEVRRREAEHNKAEVQRWGATSAQRIRVPILGLVSDMHPEMVARWRDVGMDGLLTTPIDEAQLLTVASRLFKPSEQH
ncbi:unnamed protein product [Closterium sp. NIES-65]|nr:unnamed protein product [Closterium sp. NIES-65]